jgi:hypothetical protein
MAHLNRRTAPRVRDGQVQRKNRHLETPSYWTHHQREPLVDRERPGEGYRHLLRRTDVLDFVQLIPDWNQLARGLDAIVLARGEAGCLGWHQRGVIGLCAWERELARHWSPWFHEQHAELLVRLGVPCERDGDDVRVEFEEHTARDFQLLHVLAHELGHHRDRMTNRGRVCARGEAYADSSAYGLERQVREAYFRRAGR